MSNINIKLQFLRNSKGHRQAAGRMVFAFITSDLPEIYVTLG